VVAAGLTMFTSAPPEFTDLEAVEAADRAFQCSRRMLVADLQHGLKPLVNPHFRCKSCHRFRDGGKSCANRTDPLPLCKISCIIRSAMYG
jgi:hypothetical protein